MKNSIFKSYDIRGVYPDEINESIFKNVGRAIASSLANGQKKVVLGRDMRLSGKNLYDNLAQGLVECGCEVSLLGEVPSDLVYFAISKTGVDAGVMITASHNPKEYNGVRMLKKGMEWVRGVELEEAYNNNENVFGGVMVGKKEEVDLWGEYIEHILSFVDLSKIKRLKVVVDAGNGMAGKTMEKIKDILPIDIVPMFWELDGSFPNHPSNPLEDLSKKFVSEKIIEEKADLGVVFDGDADRAFLFDEKGNFIPSENTFLLLVKSFISKNNGCKIAHDNVFSRVVPEQIKEWGGIPVASAVGLVNVRSAMKKTGALLGGETAGHYPLSANGYTDSGVISFLILLEIISQLERPLSEEIKPFNKYVKEGNINFKLNKNSNEIISQIEEIYKDGKREFIDGLTISYKDWWFNIRPSNTEPLIRLTIEANDQVSFEARKLELTNLIEKLSY